MLNSENPIYTSRIIVTIQDKTKRTYPLSFDLSVYLYFSLFPQFKHSVVCAENVILQAGQIAIDRLILFMPWLPIVFTTTSRVWDTFAIL